MMTILSSSSWNTFLDWASLLLLGEVLLIAPPYSYGRDSFFLAYLHITTITIWMANFKHMIASIWLNLKLVLRHDHPCIISSIFIVMMSWRYTWELTQSSYSSRHACNELNSHMTIQWIFPWYHLDHHLIFIAFFFFLPWNQHMVYKHYLWKYPTSNSKQILVHRYYH